MLSVGITGSLGTGKTAVARLLARQGARVLDADKIAHQLIAPGGRCFPAVVQQFGRGILKQGRIDRAKLARIVFADRGQLKKLERIIHPAVGEEIQKKLKEFAKHKKNKMTAVEVPLLFEAGLDRLMDFVIVVKVERQLQIKRIRAQRNITKADIARRLRSQMPLKEKIRLAYFVVDNSGNIKKTRTQVQNIWKQLIKK